MKTLLGKIDSLAERARKIISRAVEEHGNIIILNITKPNFQETAEFNELPTHIIHNAGDYGSIDEYALYGATILRGKLLLMGTGKAETDGEKMIEAEHVDYGVICAFADEVRKLYPPKKRKIVKRTFKVWTAIEERVEFEGGGERYRDIKDMDSAGTLGTFSKLGDAVKQCNDLNEMHRLDGDLDPKEH